MYIWCSNNQLLPYLFWQVSSESTLKRHESDQIIPAHHPSISTTTDSGRPYHAAQIEDKVCTKLLKPKFCNITSFLQFQAVDFLQLTVGKVNNSLPGNLVYSPLFFLWATIFVKIRFYYNCPASRIIKRDLKYKLLKIVLYIFLHLS